MALGFKVTFDDHGQLTFVRVYRGVLEKGMTVLAARAGRKLRVGRLVQLMADAREEVVRLEAGEIGAIVVLLDGATHATDSSELAFRIAGAAAFREAAGEAEPCLLEPVMRLEVTCPEASVGAVVGDIARRGGQVLGLDVRAADGDGVVHAEVPLAQGFGYAGALSGLSHGRGRFTLEPLRYEQVPEARARTLAVA